MPPTRTHPTRARSGQTKMLNPPSPSATASGRGRGCSVWVGEANVKSAPQHKHQHPPPPNTYHNCPAPAQLRTVSVPFACAHKDAGRGEIDRIVTQNAVCFCVPGLCNAAPITPHTHATPASHIALCVSPPRTPTRKKHTVGLTNIVNHPSTPSVHLLRPKSCGVAMAGCCSPPRTAIALTMVRGGPEWLFVTQTHLRALPKPRFALPQAEVLAWLRVNADSYARGPPISHWAQRQPYFPRGFVLSNWTFLPGIYIRPK